MGNGNFSDRQPRSVVIGGERVADVQIFDLGDGDDVAGA